MALSPGFSCVLVRKDPQWIVNSAIEISGAIRTISGGLVPASEVKAGKRIKIENWAGDVTDTGLIFLITGTVYDDASETVQLSVGQPAAIDNFLAHLARSLQAERAARATKDAEQLLPPPMVIIYPDESSLGAVDLRPSPGDTEVIYPDPGGLGPVKLH
jgi:hypothetical protein